MTRINPLEICSVLELECELLKATHDQRHALNNASAFSLRIELAKDAGRSTADDAGSLLYWKRKAEEAGCSVRNIASAIEQRRNNGG